MESNHGGDSGDYVVGVGCGVGGVGHCCLVMVEVVIIVLVLVVKPSSLAYFKKNILYFLLAISWSNFAQIQRFLTFFNGQDDGLLKNVKDFK